MPSQFAASAGASFCQSFFFAPGSTAASVTLSSTVQAR
jgi:hypothetical protein